MSNMSQYDQPQQIALYRLCWDEAAQVRFTPECLCSIFKCADAYYRSLERKNPLYRLIRDQGYGVVDGRFVRRE